MGKRGSIKYQLTESCTRRGCHSFVAQLLQNVARVWILKGRSGNRQVEFIKNLGENLAGRGYEVEFWLSALQPGGAQGVFFPQLDAAVVDDGLFHPNQASSQRIEIIALEEAREFIMSDAGEQDLALWQSRLLNYKRRAEDLIENYLCMEQYLVREGQEVNIGERVDILSQQVQEMIFGQPPVEKHFYAASLTTDGLMDYVQEITGRCRNRYIMRGPAGCGQSRILEQTAGRALSQGWEVDYYHWALDPERVCLILIPAVNSALVDDSCLAVSPQAGDIIVEMSRPTAPDQRDDNPRSRLDTLLLQVQADLDQVNRARREINRLQSDVFDPVRLGLQREKLEREIEQY
ncbi:MAG: hypothetical protein ABFD04_04350 [Syntrophomonas sp.]